METFEHIFASVEELLPESDGFECYKFRVSFQKLAK